LLHLCPFIHDCSAFHLCLLTADCTHAWTDSRFERRLRLLAHQMVYGCALVERVGVGVCVRARACVYVCVCVCFRVKTVAYIHRWQFQLQLDIFACSCSCTCSGGATSCIAEAETKVKRAGMQASIHVHIGSLHAFAPARVAPERDKRGRRSGRRGKGVHTPPQGRLGPEAFPRDLPPSHHFPIPPGRDHRGPEFQILTASRHNLDLVRICCQTPQIAGTEWNLNPSGASNMQWMARVVGQPEEMPAGGGTSSGRAVETEDNFPSPAEPSPNLGGLHVVRRPLNRNIRERTHTHVAQC
jgi:hypothetical protein